jgi:triacylglycerol lipase
MLASATRVIAELGALRGVLTAGTQGALTEYAPAGDGAPVLLIPGFLAGDRSLEPLARGLAAAGYHPCPAGMERNVDCSETATERLSDRLERLASDHGHPVAVVGHSRGGMLAKVLARRHPELVSGVVAIAAPQREPLALHPALLASAFSLGAAGSIGVRGLIRYSCAFGRCCEAFRADLARPAPRSVPYLAVYSRRDGIVDWRACLDPARRHVEVTSTHCGMAADHVTLHVVVDFLRDAHRRAALPPWSAAAA